MGDNNAHARRVLLRRWEALRMQLHAATSREERLLTAGALLHIGSILKECRHNGDGTNPIRADEWDTESMRVIRDALPQVIP